MCIAHHLELQPFSVLTNRLAVLAILIWIHIRSFRLVDVRPMITFWKFQQNTSSGLCNIWLTD